MKKIICLLFAIIFFVAPAFSNNFDDDKINGYYWLSSQTLPMDRERLSYLQQLLYDFFNTTPDINKYQFFLSSFDIDNIEDLTNIGMSIYTVYKDNPSAKILPVGWILGQIVIPILNANKIDKQKKLKDMQRYWNLLHQ